MHQIYTYYLPFTRPEKRQLHSLLVATILLLALVCAFFPTTTARAESMPGGNVQDPVIRAVNLAKPAIVRIITTLEGRLTVYFTARSQETFPREGGNYQLHTSGSGAFISSDGDILTASHVINPPDDQSLDQALYNRAAQDVATYINQNLNPASPWDELDAYSALTYGSLFSTTNYEEPTSKVYLSTDYTGPLTNESLDTMPENTYWTVDAIKKDSTFEEKDLAIIHIPMKDTPSIKLGDASTVAPLDELTILGFPGNGDVSNTDKPTAFLTSSVNRIYVSALKERDNGARLIQVGGNVEHGDSGGPALDAEGNIVGVVSFGVVGSQPQGTSFLQSSESVKELLEGLNLNTEPGEFQQMWDQAYKNYTSTAPGHWRKAHTDFKNLQTTYPNFKAIEPYLTYTEKEASKEPAPQQNNPQANAGLSPVVIGGASVAGLALIVLIALIVIRRRKQTGTNTGYNQYPNNGMYPQYNTAASSTSTQQTHHNNNGAFWPNSTEPAAAQNGVQHNEHALVATQTPKAAENTPGSSSTLSESAPPTTPWPQEVYQAQQQQAQFTPMAPSHEPQRQPVPVASTLLSSSWSQSGGERPSSPGNAPTNLPPSVPVSFQDTTREQNWQQPVSTNVSGNHVEEGHRSLVDQATVATPAQPAGMPRDAHAPLHRESSIAPGHEQSSTPVEQRPMVTGSTAPYTHIPPARPRPVQQAPIQPSLPRWNTDSPIPIPPSMAQPMNRSGQPSSAGIPQQGQQPQATQNSDDSLHDTDKMREARRTVNTQHREFNTERTVIGQPPASWPAQQQGQPVQGKPMQQQYPNGERSEQAERPSNPPPQW